MSPNDFVSLAVKLSNSAHEAELRTAVSRAYYGAFHSARDLLEDCGISFPPKELLGADVHRKIRFCLESADNGDAAFAARHLSSLRLRRNAADYDLKTRGTSFSDDRLAKTSSRAAIDIVDALQRCRSEPTFSQLRENVRAYSRDVLRLPVQDA